MSWPPAESAEGDAAVNRADRWAHRRGEPRVFALMLSIYLLLASVLTVFAAPALGSPSEAAFRRSAGMLLLLLSFAVAALWPMLRLSQASPRNPVLAAAADTAIVALMAQAVIWPLTLLPGGAVIRPAPWLGLWPWAVSAGIGLALASWASLVGAIVACGIGGRSGWGRAGWMFACVILASAAPTAGSVTVDPESIEFWLLYSPMTVTGALITAPSGLTPNMTPGDWVAAIAPGVLSLPVWLLARRVTRRAARPRWG